MKTNIWIMNHYAGGMFFDKGGRHYWFAKYLNKAGYKPVVFCANSKHGSKPECFFDNTPLWHEHMAEEINTPFVFVRTRPYVGNGKTRVFNFFDFYFNLKKTAKEYAKLHGKPDVIYASSAHPLTTIAGIQLAKYFGVKCICEVRDLWPESIVAYGLLKRESLLAKILYQGEKWIYKKANALIFTFEGGAQYIVDKGWDWLHGGPIDMDKVHHISNGVDLDVFIENKQKYRLDDEDLHNDDVFKVVYAGSIRHVNHLGTLLDAAKTIRNDKIKFFLFGDGDEVPKLKQRVLNENINNVIFKGRVDKKYVPYIDSCADLNLVHMQQSPVIQFGESLNKTFEYFAAQKPVFYTFRPNYSIAEKFGCGRLTKGFSAKEMAEGIESFLSMTDEERNLMSKNAWKAAQTYDFKVLTQKLINVVENL